MKRYAYDIETNGLLNESTVDYSGFPYVLKPTSKMHCAWIIDVDNKENRWGFRPSEGAAFLEKLKEADVIIGHNIISFDNLWIRLEFGASYFINENAYEMDVFCGKEIRFYDTLIMSKLLNPDRKGGHSLKQWGKTLKNNKIHYGTDDESIDCWETFDEEMFTYCEQDVDLTVDVFHALVEEAEDWELYWERAFRLEQAIRELITKQEHFGFAFDKNQALNTVEDLNRLMAECEAKAEPNLPPKVLSASKQPNFPAKPYMNSGAISANGKKWIARLIAQGTLDENASEAVMRTALNEQWPVVLTEPMKLSSQEDVKSYLVALGWNPTKWGERDLFTESDKKTPSTKEQYSKRIVTYVNKTVDTPFEKYRVAELGIDPVEFSKLENRKKYLWAFLNEQWQGMLEAKEARKFANKADWSSRKKILEVTDKRREGWEEKYGMGYPEIDKVIKGKTVRILQPTGVKLIVLTQPKFTVDLEKNLCPNLEFLAEEIPYATDIVHWLTYRHRRNSIASPKGTGWISQVRETDGRIPTPADTMGCNTSRFRHIGVANVPRVSSLYGEPMRALFACGKDYFQIGTDGDAIEARVQGHYIMPFPGGELEAALLLAPKPNDVHTVTAKALGITRDQAKSIRYAISYGAQPAKVAAMFGWPLSKAKEIFNEFWRVNGATAALREALVREWENTGKTYIIGIDGRKLATRSAHSLLNTQFQSCGVIIMKKAHLISDRQAKEEGYCNDPFVGKPTAMSMICYHDEDQKAVAKSDVTFKMFKTEEETKEFVKAQDKRWSDIGHTDKGYYAAYSRVGEMTSLALEEAGKHFQMQASITGGYMLGKDWASCH